ncbi:Pre-mRNA splicing Prp18-interacting factor-domain-containing protein [Lipomyces kononenkoae]|uniref:Pre-mRNA splicing Prp18-interacting factor-domain-containing protein n=1 Tax=Lipomyces kononenkoae TaxID=34357 RepID=A0ACC3T8V4_LIPKO
MTEQQEKFNFKTFDQSAPSKHDNATSPFSARKVKGKELPIERDAEGKEINPYIPQFISKAPWYVDSSGEVSLRHQRKDQTESLSAETAWYKRGVKAGAAATKYRKGACENCGAMTHKAKDCMERPRKVGAKFSGKDIQADDLIQDVKMTWESKRDRWNGYDASEHQKLVQEYQKLEQLRKEKEEEKGEDGDHYDTEATKVPGQGYDSDARMSTRTLRIREDAAKYLKNLNSNGEEYNPKSRTMKNGNDGLLASDDDFVRQSGEAEEFESLKRFAWDAAEKGENVHIQANPTEGALAKRKYEQESMEKSERLKKQLIEKYG